MANLVITSHREKGKGRVFDTPCPVFNIENEKRVGNPTCCNSNCPHFRKFVVKKVNGKEQRMVHCEW